MRETLLDRCEKQSPPGSAQHLKLAKSQSQQRETSRACARVVADPNAQVLYPAHVPLPHCPRTMALSAAGQALVEISWKSPNARPSRVYGCGLGVAMSSSVCS